MKIGLVSEYFYPKSSGGTEKYVYDLANKLLAENHDVEVITVGESTKNYKYEEITVKAISFKNEADPDVISGIKPSQNLHDFKSIIQSSEYDLIHFHTLTPAFNLHHIKIAREIVSQIHFTAHVPSITCIHGDLMQFGKIPCDGLILNHRCTACYLSKKRSIPISKILSRTISLINYPKTIARVVTKKKTDLTALNELCDCIYVFTHWQHRIFIANGFEPSKIQITSQILNKKITPSTSSDKLNFQKLGFVGRLSPEKGLDILIKAFNNSKRSDLQLHIAGIKDDNHKEYQRQLEMLSHNNPNIFWNFDLTNNEIKAFYKSIDVLCIPSVWYETGPFVLYEAFENNLPVIANNLGDMGIWKEKGYHIELYHNIAELTTLLSTTTNLIK